MNIIEKIKKFGNVILFCLKFTVKASPKYFILHILLDILSALLPFFIIRVMSLLINLFTNASGNSIKQLLGLLLLLTLLNIIKKEVGSLKIFLEGLYNDIMSMKSKHKIMEKAANIDLFYFDSPNFYNDINEAQNNCNRMIHISFRMFSLIQYLVQFCISFASLILWNGFLPWILVISVIPTVWFKNKQLGEVYEFHQKHIEHERKANYILNIFLDKKTSKDVRIYNLFPLLIKKITYIWTNLYKNKKSITMKYTKMLVAIESLPELIAMISLFKMGMEVISGVKTIGDFSYFQGIIEQVTAGIYMIVYDFNDIYDGEIRMKKYIKFMNYKNKITDTGKINLTKNIFTIEFKNVSFKYDENSKYVLNNLNFKIQSNQKVALVGINGCGKTTIIKLILRFYEPTDGKILIDNIDIHNYSINSIRKNFSPMFQDYNNYAFTVSDNVSLSDYKNANNEYKIKKTLHQSGADVFVNNFSDKEHTYLTKEYENGEELSGGQWQKIALSRAFFRDANIYILDEPSSALDAESEDKLFKKFEEMYKDKGAILISHRLSNVIKSDYILVIDNGKVIEEGKHDDLIALNKKYAYMYNLQAQKYSL